MHVNLHTLCIDTRLTLTLGVKYELQWTLRHYDLVIGECPLAGFKTVKVKPAF
jgi:hypothetical protein